jgi:DNA mismatch endonuclease, patch repair protein
MTADLVFSGARVAVFIDGCFWHGCPDHYKVPRTNTAYWAPKISRNVQRDHLATDLLKDAGWLVLRFWEHENPVAVAAAIAKAVRSRRT